MFGPGGFFGPSQPKSPGEAAMKATGGNDGQNERYSGSGFDPTGLERAAKAAKILDKSPSAKGEHLPVL